MEFYNIGYAVDIVLIAVTDKKLQELLRKIIKESKKKTLNKQEENIKSTVRENIRLSAKGTA